MQGQLIQNVADMTLHRKNFKLELVGGLNYAFAFSHETYYVLLPFGQFYRIDHSTHLPFLDSAFDDAGEE